MHQQLLAQSPLLILPIVALFLFATVFVAVALRAFLTAQPVLDAMASLPLADEGEARHDA